MAENKLQICAVTTTRADYGIMRPLLLKLNEAEWANLKLCVTGTHLLKQFGYTVVAAPSTSLAASVTVGEDILRYGQTTHTVRMRNARTPPAGGWWT